MRFCVKYLRNRGVDLTSRISLKPRNLAVLELFGSRRNINETQEVKRGLKLRMDLRKPKRVIKRATLFGRLFRMKQTLRLFYGFTREKPFKRLARNTRNIFADRATSFVSFLESGPVSLMFRSGFVRSPEMARQWISHGYVLLNGKVLKSADVFLKAGDLLSLSPTFHPVCKICLLSRMHEGTFFVTSRYSFEVNYKTCEIFVFDKARTDTLFPFKVDTARVLSLYS
jgi:small subunit ribosomal protein S4